MNIDVGIFAVIAVTFVACLYIRANKIDVMEKRPPQAVGSWTL
jgi:hypothetical protein